jgi:hypothetical protein
MDIEAELTAIRLGLGQKRLNRSWAKAEIIIGLLTTGLGLLISMPAVLIGQDISWFQAIAGLMLFVLGSYLALAGHRSHLYQSANELTAYLAEKILAARRTNSLRDEE